MRYKTIPEARAALFAVMSKFPTEPGPTDQDKTDAMQEWFLSMPDDLRLKYAINRHIPHTWFNVTCKLVNSTYLQNIDWYRLFTDNNLGLWDYQTAK